MCMGHKDYGTDGQGNPYTEEPTTGGKEGTPKLELL